MDDALARYEVDEKRVYLTGLSMGGYGAWHWACARPERFAALAPVCGGGDPTRACALKDMPVWAFHGAEDEVVPLKKSEEMVDAVNACGGNAELTVYLGCEARLLDENVCQLRTLRLAFRAKAGVRRATARSSVAASRDLEACSRLSSPGARRTRRGLETSFLRHLHFGR